MNIQNSAYRTVLISLVIALAALSSWTATPQDFDGDGKSDPVVVRRDPSGPNFVWYSLNSRDGFSATTWGLQAGDYPYFDCDFDGDGRAELVVAGNRNGQLKNWWIFNSRDSTYRVAIWGASGDLEVPQDYDGDGKTDLAVYRNGLWLILRSSDNQPYSERFGGLATDSVFRGGDYDGDGKADLAVVRRPFPNGNGTPLPTTLYLRLSQTGSWAAYELGDARFTGVLSGDYDGDGKADVAIWQGSLWLWVRSSDGRLEGFRFGQPSPGPTGDLPVPADYDGDGKTDVAIYRRGQSQQSYFWIQQSRDGLKVVPWGGLFDAPPGAPGSTRYIPAVVP